MPVYLSEIMVAEPDYSEVDTFSNNLGERVARNVVPHHSVGSVNSEGYKGRPGFQGETDPICSRSTLGLPDSK